MEITINNYELPLNDTDGNYLFTAIVETTPELWARRNEPWIKAGLLGARVKWACENGASLANADLAGANLRGFNLSGIDLSGADLRGADLRETMLEGTNFNATNLTGVDFVDAEIWDANFSGAIIGRFWADLALKATTYIDQMLTDKNSLVNNR